MNQLPELEHPLWLLLIIPVVIGWLCARDSFFIKKPFAHLPLSTAKKSVYIGQFLRFGSSGFLRVVGMIMLILALGDPTRTSELIVEDAGVHRIFLILDSSSSMYGFQQDRFSSITCPAGGKFFPRIKGACKALHRVIDEVERFSKQKGRGIQDLLGLVQFATHSYVISYPTSDYQEFRRKVDAVNFYLHGVLGIATEMQLAIWDAYLMALDRNMTKNSGFTYLGGKDIRMLAVALGPGGSPLRLPDELRDKLMHVRMELRDTVFIVITDAVVSFLHARVEYGMPYSIRRQMQLAEFLEVPFFYLSTDEFYPELKHLARATGSGPLGGPNRGDFLMVKKHHDYEQMADLMDIILKARFAQKVENRIMRRVSYAELLVACAFGCFVASLLAKKTFARALTDGE